MSLIDNLVTADRYVLAGLQAYDVATSRIVEAEREKSIAAGVPSADIDAAIVQNQPNMIAARERLHRELWERALLHICHDTQEAAGA